MSFKQLITGCALLATLSMAATQVHATQSFRLAWSLYPGYMPWDYASEAGIVNRWADKYGIEIEIVQINDYVEAINQYTAGEFDAAMMATLDALTIPAASGMDSTSIAVIDYSNGNDVIIMRDGESLNDLAGKRINIIEYSISHYFLIRALEQVGLSERDVTLVNTSDADMVSLFAHPSTQAIVTWNPMASDILQQPDAVNVYDSSQMPGELTDSIVVNTATLEKHPELGKALLGAWFETMAIMQGDDAEAVQAREAMGIAAGTDLAGYEQQLEATYLFYSPEEVANLMAEQQLQDTMANIASFSFERGLLGSGQDLSETIGISYPDGSVWGNADNVTLRFNNEFATLAAEGAL